MYLETVSQRAFSFEPIVLLTSSVYQLAFSQFHLFTGRPLSISFILPAIRARLAIVPSHVGSAGPSHRPTHYPSLAVRTSRSNHHHSRWPGWNRCVSSRIRLFPLPVFLFPLHLSTAHISFSCPLGQTERILRSVYTATYKTSNLMTAQVKLDSSLRDEPCCSWPSPPLTNEKQQRTKGSRLRPIRATRVRARVNRSKGRGPRNPHNFPPTPR